MSLESPVAPPGRRRSHTCWNGQALYANGFDWLASVPRSTRTPGAERIDHRVRNQVLARPSEGCHRVRAKPRRGSRRQPPIRTPRLERLGVSTPLPAGGGRDDLRILTAASTCPPFRRGPSAFTSIEVKVKSDGIGEPHITQTFAGRSLVLIPDVTASDTPTSNAAHSRSLQRSYPGTTDTAGFHPKIQATQHCPNPSCAPPASP